MPTYEYVCSSCGNEWEFEQSIKDAALTECPACHDATARRQISRGTGFILKGSGWYSDLYSSPSNQKTETKTETKTEAKTEGDSGGDKKAASSTDGASSSTPAAKSEPSTAAA